MNPYDYEDEEILEDPNEVELNFLIDQALSRLRPKRYFTNDRTWIGPVVELAITELERRPQDVRELALKKVVAREGEATRSANRHLRKIALADSLSATWGIAETWRLIRVELLSLPISLSGGERVRLGAATAGDLRKWIEIRKNEAERRARAEHQAWRGAEILAELAESQGVDCLDELPERLPKKK